MQVNLEIKCILQSCLYIVDALVHILKSSVQWFFKLTMLHAVLDRQKTTKTILEKAFFFILWRFYLFSVFVSQHLKTALLWGDFFLFEIGHTRYQKNDFKLISKKQTCQSNKMSQKTVKINKRLLFFLFFNLSFWWAFRHQGKFAFLKPAWNSWIWPISKTKIFTSQNGHFKFFHKRMKKR
jgi:hypothetical protein